MPTITKWIPRIVWNGVTFNLTFPQRRWEYETQGDGGSARAGHKREAFNRLWDELLYINLRFFEWEWPDVNNFIRWAMANPGTSFVVRMDQDDALSAVDVYLESPVMGDKVHPTRAPEGIGELYDLPLVLRKTDGTRFDFRMYQAGPIAIQRVDIAPMQSILDPTETVQLDAVAKDPWNNVVAGSEVWSSSNPAVATVSATGLVTAVAPGDATIFCYIGGVQGWAAVRVDRPVVATVTVTPNPINIAGTASQQATATVRDALNNILTDRVVSWFSSNTAVATVSSSGVVTGVAAGNAIITATCEGVQGSANCVVT